MFKLSKLCIQLRVFVLFSTHFPTRSYQILNPKDISGMDDPKKCSKILIESTELDPDLYRLGHTKAWTRFFFDNITKQQQKTLFLFTICIVCNYANKNVANRVFVFVFVTGLRMQCIPNFSQQQKACIAFSKTYHTNVFDCVLCSLENVYERRW